MKAVAIDGMKYELGSRKSKRTQRLSRPFAVKFETKHLDKLKTRHIVFYVLRRHQEFIGFVLFGVVWFVIGLTV